GRRGAIRHVSMACLGSGPRELIGTDTVSARAFVELEIDGRGAITVLDAYSGPDFATAIARTDLPVSLAYGDWTVVRDDQ
ncbi:MAG TPA: hypothetical protein VFG69_09875, partial [Nannocystaceae bacterium]|nr:hypothetical protein [Nannocystaceae bacterium]